MNHYTILGCDDNIILNLFEILTSQHSEKCIVDIVKNIPIHVSRHPYETKNISSREIDASELKRISDTKYLFGVVKPTSKHIVHEYFLKHFSINNDDFASLIHKDASIANTCNVRNGVIINPGIIIAPFTTIERFVFLNRNVSLGHHTRIGEYTQINPAVNIAGHCSIGNNVVIGMSAIIFEGLRIGENSIIGAGSLVTKDVPDNVLVYGTPAKVVRDL